MEPPGLAVREQQSCRHDARPARNLREARPFAAGALVEPAGGFSDSGEHLRLQALVMPAQHQRRVNQPSHQPEARMLHLPRRALAGLAVGVEPHRGDPLGHRRRLGARGSGGEISQPAEAVQHPLHRRSRPGRTGKVEARNRQAHAVDEEMPGPQRGTSGAVPAIGTLDRRQHPQGLRSAERLAERMTRDAHAIGQPDERLTRAGGRRNDIAQRQCAAGFLGKRRRDGRGLRLALFGHRQHRNIRHPLHQRIGPAASGGSQQRRQQPNPFSAAILAA